MYLASLLAALPLTCALIIKHNDDLPSESLVTRADVGFTGNTVKGNITGKGFPQAGNITDDDAQSFIYNGSFVISSFEFTQLTTVLTYLNATLNQTYYKTDSIYTLKFNVESPGEVDRIGHCEGQPSNRNAITRLYCNETSWAWTLIEPTNYTDTQQDWTLRIEHAILPTNSSRATSALMHTTTIPLAKYFGLPERSSSAIDNDAGVPTWCTDNRSKFLAAPQYPALENKGSKCKAYSANLVSFKFTTVPLAADWNGTVSRPDGTMAPAQLNGRLRI